MKMKKFELFMCCLGNGTTVSNKAVMEDGDFKNICHISEQGKITWYVDVSYVPSKDLLTIEHEADILYHNFFDNFEKQSEMKQYEYLCNKAKLSDLLECCGMKDATLTEKIQFLKDKVFNY